MILIDIEICKFVNSRVNLTCTMQYFQMKSRFKGLKQWFMKFVNYFSKAIKVSKFVIIYVLQEHKRSVSKKREEMF